MEERDNILSFAMEQLHEPFFNSAMDNLSIVEDKMRFVYVFFGGHTVILGNFNSEIGLVSIVVVTGLDFHDWNDW